MKEPDVFKLFIDHLNLCKILYVVTGSAAAIIYGEPRITYDIDIVIEFKVY